ncbi:hypothetical protein LCGC14_0730360 [marine sediment metagenome]|uniref:Uncharacterized protein n=1 Tax=marine sediment metagenome TaxID=412755 RepID=A0A0F9TH04_9ZZZZ
MAFVTVVMMIAFVLCLATGDYGSILIAVVLLAGFECIEKVLKDKQD